MKPDRHKRLLERTAQLLNLTASSETWGPDLDWFASDREGHVALMTTAGLGPVPVRVTQDAPGLVAVIESLETVRGVEFDQRWGFQRPDEVGVFAFDYRTPDGEIGMYLAGYPLRRVGDRPTHPVTLDELEGHVRAYLRDLAFANVCFGDVQELVVENELSEIHRPTHWVG